MNHLVSKVEGLNVELASKQRVIEQQTAKLEEMEKSTNAAKHEAKLKSDGIAALQETLRRIKVQNEQLESKLKDTRDKLADSQISRHKLETVNGGLQEGECCLFAFR